MLNTNRVLLNSSWILFIGALVPAVLTLSLWIRSHYVLDDFSYHREIARWPDGREQPTNTPKLLRLIWDGKLSRRPIYLLKNEQLDSYAGAIGIHYYLRKDDLDNNVVWYAFVGEFGEMNVPFGAN